MRKENFTLESNRNYLPNILLMLLSATKHEKQYFWEIIIPKYHNMFSYMYVQL